MELSDLSVLHIIDNQNKDENLYSLLCNTVSKVTNSLTIIEAKQQYLKQSQMPHKSKIFSIGPSFPI